MDDNPLNPGCGCGGCFIILLFLVFLGLGLIIVALDGLVKLR